MDGVVEVREDGVQVAAGAEEIRIRAERLARLSGCSGRMQEVLMERDRGQVRRAGAERARGWSPRRTRRRSLVGT